MGIFKNKFKRVDSQNVTAVPIDAPVAPRIAEPKMPSPMMIANISKAVMENMELPKLEENKPDLQKLLQSKIEEIENDIRVKQEALKVLKSL